MSRISKLFHKQSKLKGKIAVAGLSKEGFTNTWYADVYDADTGESRTLDATGPYLITFDPQNKRKLGSELGIPLTASQTGSRVTFSNTKRGISKDAMDDFGNYANAVAWPIGTEIGITTEHINDDLLKEYTDGTRAWDNSMHFSGDQKFRGTLGFEYTPAFLTCGSSPTTSASTWAAVTDGAFQFTLNGVARSVTGLDFTNVGNNDQVARVIQAGIRALTSSTETVEWNGTAFIIRSNDLTSSSAITVLTAGASGTDISGAGATAFLDGDTGHGTVTDKNKGLLISASVADATELAALTNVALGAEAYVTGEGKKYDYLAGSWVARESGGTFVNAADHTAGKVDIASATEIGAGTAVDATSGAINVIPVSQTAKTSSGAGDENKLPVLDNTGKLPSGFIPTISIGDLQTFSSNGTWTKPTTFTPKFVKVIAYGAGGGGGGGEGRAAGNVRYPGGGGGGGAKSEKIFSASDVTDTVAVTIGVGGPGGAGGSSADGTYGTAGGTTTFGAYLSAFGGGRGQGGGTPGSGGGGGGTGGVGGNGADGADTLGGYPGSPITVTAYAIGGQGGGGINNTSGGCAEFGGGGGGGGGQSTAKGGSSIYGAGGGGAGGYIGADNSNNATGAADGGASGSYTAGGGGAGATGSAGAAGGVGANGNSTKGGQGGGNGAQNGSGTGGKGGNGGTHGGGGGGGGAGTSVGGAGGDGGAGYVYVYTW